LSTRSVRSTLQLALAPQRLFFAGLVMVLGTGCWEQWSVTWWPQMKYQKAVQAFEETGHPGADASGGFMPPDGAVPVGAPLDLRVLSLAETEALESPQHATLASLANGKEQYEIFCTTCHGPQGGGDGPVGGPPFGTGPLIGVLPIGGQYSAAKGLSDGHIFTTMTLGRGRMPSYRRIPAADRWDILNYVRYLNGQVQPQKASAEGATP
jgi:mono/diheme cytochrome c family protein